MKQEIKVPSAGESITSGIVGTWLKQNGDVVTEGENLFEFETEKAVIEVASPASGQLEIQVVEGTEVAIGQTVAVLDTEVATPKATEAVPETPASAEPAKVVESAPEPPTPAPKREAPAPAMPTAPIAPPKPKGRVERVPMTPIRKTTAARLVKAKQDTAYLTTFNEIDMQKVMDIRSHYKDAFLKEHGIKIGFMSFFVKACCQALKAFPAVNAQIDGDDIVYQHFYDIGVAVSLETGLMVPIIRGADTLHFADIESTLVSLVQRAQQKKLMPDELTGGTFTITNGGVFGSLFSTPIPAYPQTAILGMHAIKKRPVVVDDQIVIRPMMYVALTYDHRVIDGRDAVSFLAKVKDFIEEPDKLLLEL